MTPQSQSARHAIPIASIRFQISLVLLLSALNGIVLVALAVVWFPDAATEQVSDDVLLGGLQERLSTLHRLILADDIAAGDQDDGLDDLQAQVADLGERAQDVGYALKDYRWTLSARRVGEPQTDGDQELRRAHYRVVGALQVLRGETDSEPAPIWVLGAMLTWVVFTTLATLLVALALRRVLSEPLRNLAQAASQVADGDLTSPFPTPGGADEFRRLGLALESMRSKLVRSIQSEESQNAVQAAMLRVLNDGVIFLDQEDRTLGFNPAAVAILEARGVTLEEGMALQTAVPQLPPGPVSGWAGEQLRLDLETDGVFQNLTVRAHRTAITAPGERSAWVVVVRDVTRAVEVERLKRDFLSVVTHELKTPLTVIDGYLRLLMRGKGGVVSERQADLLQRSSGQVEVLGRMIQDLLDATRLEGGNLPMDLGEVDVHAAVEECVGGLTGEAERRGIHLSYHGADPPRLLIAADSFRLQQVLGNLVRNALKFTESEGRVTLRCAAREGEVRIDVQDTGRGIPANALTRLFDKFYQVQRGDTRIAGGAGLGLYICAQLMQAMGGRMEVSSTLGEGSTFTAVLPLAMGQEESS